MTRKKLAVLLGLAVVAVFAHFVFSPFYDNMVDSGPIWNVLNWFIAAGTLTSIVVSAWARKTDQHEEPLLCVAVALGILFCWNWFNELVVGDEVGTVRAIAWVVVNTLFVVIAGRTSIKLWKP